MANKNVKNQNKNSADHKTINEKLDRIIIADRTERFQTERRRSTKKESGEN